MKVVKRIVAACSYTNKAGEEKTNWVEMGAMWKTDEGKFRININAVPTVNWDGWCTLQDPREPQEAKPVKQEKPMQEVLEDDIPF